MSSGFGGFHEVESLMAGCSSVGASRGLSSDNVMASRDYHDIMGSFW